MGVTNHLLTGMMNLQVNPSPLPASLGSKSPREASICRGRQSSDESQPAIADNEGREQIRLMVKNPKKNTWDVQKDLPKPSTQKQHNVFLRGNI